jgi:molybdopterin-guanine dinucleotide biosynthesis protein A
VSDDLPRPARDSARSEAEHVERSDRSERRKAGGGIVLAGGKSTRMGTSKALLPFGPETMLQRVVRLLGDIVTPIVVVAAADQALPELPPAVIVTRDERQGRGPLEGLRAGLKALPPDVDAAYVTSCDVPLLVPGFVTQMLDLARGYDIAVMEIDGFPHPLSAVYRRSTLPHIEDLLAHDRLRPVFLFEAVRTRRVHPEAMTADPDLRTLRNLNTPEDYERALADAARDGSAAGDGIAR